MASRIPQNPSELCLIDANITSVLQLTLHASIISLNLHCNLLKKIEGLELLQNLKYLDLSSNNIERITGVEELISLKYLNLSCNQITVVEGLESLQSLVKLDLSYNCVSDLSGLKALGTNGSCLTTLYLHGNQVYSIDHIIDCLSDLYQLKEVVFSQNSDSNPACNHAKYRSLVLSMLSNIEVLDNLDRNGHQAVEEYHSANAQMTDIDDYVNYLLSSESIGSSKAVYEGSSQTLTTPRIDEVLSKFRSQEAPNGVVGKAHQKLGTLPAALIVPKISPIANLIKFSSRARDYLSENGSGQQGKVALSADHEVRLERLEHQLAHILYQPVPAGKDDKQRSTSSDAKVLKSTPDISPESETDKTALKTKCSSPKFRRRPTTTKAKPKRTVKNKKEETTSGKTVLRTKALEKYTESTTSGNETEGQRAEREEQMMVEGKKYVRHPEDDATFLSLIQELDLERERRWKAEQAALKLVDHVKELQIKVAEEKKLEEAALTASTRLKETLQKERQEKTELQQNVTELQVKYEDVSENLKNCRETEEEQRKALRAMEAATTKLETERMQQHAHETLQSQEHQMKAAALARELELLKNTNKQLKGQVQQLQELLASREHQHKVEMTGLIRPDSRDVREIIDREITKQETRFEQLVKQWEEKLLEKTQEYMDLEDEFRMALQIEAKRFRELQDEFQKSSEECAQNKQSLQAARQKENKATSMVTELAGLVKEQKIRISELSKSKQEALSQQKERIITLEDEVKIARKRISKIEVLEQDKSKLLSQIRAQESVIQGLRMERKLWSEELAQQGASLAQDRGRLESKVESLSAEIKQLQGQLDSANDSIRIKSKMLEDQTDSIRQLKQNMVERDNEMKKTECEREKLKDLEEQLERELVANQDLREKSESLLQRKEKLKDELATAQSELDKAKEANRSLKTKWQERSELIGRLEQEVKQMTKQFETKEKKLTEEKDEAIQSGNSAMEKLHACDNAFRNQLEKQKDVYEREIDRLTREKEEAISQANHKVSEVEDEMRQILQDAASSKKSLEMRIKKLTNAFNEIQNDLAS